MRLLTNILVLTFLSCVLHAQTSISIVDDNFKECLQSNYPQLMDGEKLDTSLSKTYKGALTCPSRGIKTVPELIHFDSIESLNLSENALQSLPPLDMPLLTFFYVAQNQLTELPPLDSLQALERLICWKNKLTSLPDITMLHNLYRLDVPVNQLTEFPELSPNAPMKTILVDDNFITNLPDLSSYSNLEIVKVVNNQMSFDELDIILSQPNSDIYDYYPQKFFNVLKDIVINEGDSLVLVYPQDQNNSNVTIRWMKDGTFLNYEGDSLVVYPSSSGDSGKYIAITTSTLFPNKPLYTNLITVQVNECPLLENVAYNIKDAQCTQPGKVSVETPEAYSFELVGKHNYLPDSNNIFNGIKTGTYSLITIHPSGCEKTVEDLTVNSIDCEEIIITPDDDGYQDSFYFDYTGQGIIYDKFGNTILTVVLPYRWDGKADHKKVTPGYYTLDINQGETQIGITVVY